MTGPGASGASRMRIAGIALLAVAAVAAVVGLISLGGQGSSDTTAAAPSPAATSTAVPGQPAAPGAPAATGEPAPPVTGSLAPSAGAPIVPAPDNGAAAPAGAPAGAAAGAGGAAGGAAPVGGSGGSAVPAVPVRVLNNSMIPGLAERVAADMRSRGWNVVYVGNYPGGVIPTSTVYYRPGTDEQSAATDAAGEFGVRSEPRFAGIAPSDPGMIVIATNDWGNAPVKGS